jgi:hypothetical protein
MSLISKAFAPYRIFSRDRQKITTSLSSPVPSVCGKANRHHSTRVFGSHFVLDDGRSRKQAARFQDLLQQPSHAYLMGRANAGYARVTTSSQSRLVSLAIPLSSPIPDTSRFLLSVSRSWFLSTDLQGAFWKRFGKEPSLGLQIDLTNLHALLHDQKAGSRAELASHQRAIRLPLTRH